MLLKDKGTPIRLVFELSNGKFVLINPLEYSSVGLIINHPTNLNLGTIDLVDETNKIVASIELNKETRIIKIESFVLYPDGSTWTGRILNEKESNIEKMIWSKTLSDNLNLKEISSQFINEDWRKTPTIISIYSDLICGDCTRISHTCSDCDKFSKTIEIKRKKFIKEVNISSS